MNRSVPEYRMRRMEINFGGKTRHANCGKEKTFDPAVTIARATRPARRRMLIHRLVIPATRWEMQRSVGFFAGAAPAHMPRPDTRTRQGQSRLPPTPLDAGNCRTTLDSLVHNLSLPISA